MRVHGNRRAHPADAEGARAAPDRQLEHCVLARARAALLPGRRSGAPARRTAEPSEVEELRKREGGKAGSHVAMSTCEYGNSEQERVGQGQAPCSTPGREGRCNPDAGGSARSKPLTAWKLGSSLRIRLPVHLTKSMNSAFIPPITFL